MGEGNPFPVKTYNVNGREFSQRPLSFFEILEMPETVVGIVEKLPEGTEITGSMIAFYAKGELQGLICRVLGVEIEDLKEIPGDVGMQIVADFMEMNLSENFLEALRRTVEAGKRIYSELVKS
jgi:hypothetical protein